ncbi:MAG: FAD-dependent oxidoreductase [Clostridia bacterium]|nr:FAD-dependent oxidoreductase [Clostridia bacterium]
MNVNSLSSFYPPQPCNPGDFDRYMLEQYALNQRGRPEDFEYIKRLMSPPADITTIVSPGSLKGIRVGIIGAGLAGLSAAFELRKTGADITLFEAEESRVGGRVYTYYFDKETPLYGELGSMRIPVSHETVWHYINLFKLPTRPFIQFNENTFIYLKNTRVRNDAQGKNVMMNIYPKYQLKDWERVTPWQQLVYYGLESPLLCADAIKRSELLQVKPIYNPYILYWDFQSNRRIMERSLLSQGGINLISSMAPLPGENLYNSYIDIAQANYPANLSFLYEIPGGTSRLPYAFYYSLKNNYPMNDYPHIPVHLLGKVIMMHGNWITGIHREPAAGKVTLKFSNKENKRDRFEVFDYVVCAIPFSTLRNVDINPLFSSLKMQAIKEVNYIDSMKSLMFCSKRFWEEGGPDEQIIGGGSLTDLPITSLWYPSDHASFCKNQTTMMYRSYPYHKLYLSTQAQKNLASEPGVMIGSYNYSLDAVRLGNLSPDICDDEIKREVEQVHGLPKGYLDKIVLDTKTVDWNREPWARGGLCFFTPEQKRLFSYAMALPEYDNRVFMAGDHISAVHRWMQGALHSGMKAANDLAAACIINNK